MPLVYKGATQEQRDEIAYLQSNSDVFVTLENALLASNVSTVHFVEDATIVGSHQYGGLDNNTVTIKYNPQYVSYDIDTHTVSQEGLGIVHEMAHRFDPPNPGPFPNEDALNGMKIENEVRAELGKPIRQNYDDETYILRTAPGASGSPPAINNYTYLNPNTDPNLRTYLDNAGDVSKVVSYRPDGGYSVTEYGASTGNAWISHTVSTSLGHKLIN